MDAGAILETMRRENVRFLRLRFTDILGGDKSVEVPASQFQRALAGRVVFDGSAIEGFVRIEESDMVLCPDLDTFVVYPWRDQGEQVARIICDVHRQPGTPYEGCPRGFLRRVLDRARGRGYEVRVGGEMEFFLLERDERRCPTTRTSDSAGYFDLSPGNRGEECRRLIALRLEEMGIAIEDAHHEVAPGQHEIVFASMDALSCADAFTTARAVARRIASSRDLHATFMPKPRFGENGSGLHFFLSLLQDGANAFSRQAKEKNSGAERPDHAEKTDRQNKNEAAALGLSPLARGFIAGQLRHAKGMAAVTNPLVNSYKRLVEGHEAPVNVAWSEKNRSPLIRVPTNAESKIRVENRMPDSACNPYLALGLLLAAGLDGIEDGDDPGEPINKNINDMSHRERRHLRIDDLPMTLGEALRFFRKDHKFTRKTLGDGIYFAYLEAKTREWTEYSRVVHPWEIERYLSRT